jgi:dATP pyrophosphohydrolase
MREPVQVLVYPFRIINKQPQYLLLKRIKSRGDFWQGVTGAINKEEALPTAALRELYEETSLNCASLMDIGCKYFIPLDEKWKYLYADDVHNIEENVFAAYLEGEKDPIIDPREHNDWKWCTFDEAIELLKWKENIEALKQVKSYLSRKSMTHFL